MKRKRGFTLVEVLVVVAIMSVLLILVVPSITGSSSSTRKKAYDTKVALIEDGAVLYGQEHYREIVNNADNNLSGYSKKVIDNVTYRIYTLKVKDLVREDYLTADIENCSTNCVLDPRNSGTYLDENQIEIRINTNTRKVTAEYRE